MFVILEAQREAFGEALRELSRRRSTNQLRADDPQEGDPVSGKAWLERNGVIVQPGATGVPFFYQTVANPCLTVPPFELLADPIPPVPYGFPEFYCEQCRQPGGSSGPVRRPFYMKRLSDYTLSHCGG